MLGMSVSRAFVLSKRGLGADDFPKAVQHLRQVLGGRTAEALADALYGRRPDLTDLDRECFGNSETASSSVTGKPARRGRLVRAIGMIVPERSLNTSWLRISTGRCPACSAAPDRIEARPSDVTPQYSGGAASSLDRLRPAPAPLRRRAWRTPVPSDSGRGGPASDIKRLIARVPHRSRAGFGRAAWGRVAPPARQERPDQG
jgi:hypothetical protein